MFSSARVLLEIKEQRVAVLHLQQHIGSLLADT